MSPDHPPLTDEEIQDRMIATVAACSKESGLSRERVCELALTVVSGALSDEIGPMGTLEVLAGRLTEQLNELQRQGVDVGDGFAIPLDRGAGTET